MDEHERLKEACRALIRLYRTFYGGFTGQHRIKEWVTLCEQVGEPMEEPWDTSRVSQ